MRILKKPRVYLIARPQIVEEGLQAFLDEQGLDWPTPIEGVTDAERLVEISGRNCYMSYGKKAVSKDNHQYIQNLVGRNADGSFRPGPSHGSVCEHPCWSFLIVGAGRGFCYDSNTEVLTEEGWKFWSDIRGDEKLATLNCSSNELEYQELTNIIRQRYIGKMYCVKSKFIDMVVTPEHDMLVQNAYSKTGVWLKKKPDEIYGKSVRYKCSAAWKGETPNVIDIPEFQSSQTIANQYGSYGSKTVICAGIEIKTKVFAQFLGYWLSEGSLDHQHQGGYFVTLSQNEDGRCWDGMIECVDAMGLYYAIKRTGTKNCKQIRISGGRALYEFLKPMHGAPNKYIPTEFKRWNTNLLRILIDAYLDGDGSFTKRGPGEGYTASKKLADDLQEIAIKAGWAATIRVYDRRDEQHICGGKLINCNHLSYVVGFRKKRTEHLVNWNNKRQDQFIDYDGMVYCATVPNGTLYVRRNGFPVWSCNSHEQVRHRVGWAYSQLSTRYCDIEREGGNGTWDPGFCIPPMAQLSEETTIKMEGMLLYSQHMYVDLLHRIEEDLQNNEQFMDKLKNLPEREAKRTLRKAARGAARDVLPIATEAIMTMSANARGIWNCIVLRANEHAEAVIRDIYVQMAKIMEKEMPALFNGLEYIKVWDGSEAVIMPREKL